MPLFYQQDINADTRIGLWKIEEPAAFFLEKVPVRREITHPHKQLQHLAGRYLLRALFPDFPMDLILVADTRKPYLEDESYHFSISHCGDWAAAIVSRSLRVGIDVEQSTPKIRRVVHKFLDPSEQHLLLQDKFELSATLLWSAKESMFKWHGLGAIDFSTHLRLLPFTLSSHGRIPALFLKPEVPVPLELSYRIWDGLCVSWISSLTH
jgi:phosphopantetheinyl transferase